MNPVVFSQFSFIQQMDLLRDLYDVGRRIDDRNFTLRFYRHPREPRRMCLLARAASIPRLARLLNVDVFTQQNMSVTRGGPSKILGICEVFKEQNLGIFIFGDRTSNEEALGETYTNVEIAMLRLLRLGHTLQSTGRYYTCLNDASVAGTYQELAALTWK